MADLLIEIICEEIPARMQARAAADLERLMLARLGEAGLAHGAAPAGHAPLQPRAAVARAGPDRGPDLGLPREYKSRRRAARR